MLWVKDKVEYTICLGSQDNSWKSTTLSPPKKLTSSTANLQWCHVHFIRDSYSTFIRRVIGPSKNSMELFSNTKFDFKSIWNRDSTTSHHKHPVCQSYAGDTEKLTSVWSRYFGTNRIIITRDITLCVCVCLSICLSMFVTMFVRTI